MKKGFFLTALLSALPAFAGTMFTVDPTQMDPLTIGAFAPGQKLYLSVTGTIDILGRDGLWPTNPDGSLVSPLNAECDNCFTAQYEAYINPGSPYPAMFGGDAVNHFAGGGANFDMLNGPVSYWAAEGKRTTDTTDPDAIRLGALAYTFSSNPGPDDWKLAGGALGGGFYGSVVTTPDSGGTLRVIVVDTSYWNNIGTFQLNVSEVPEPSAAWLALSGLALLPIIRRRRCTAGR